MALVVAALIGCVIGFIVGCLSAIAWKERRDAGSTSDAR